MHDCPKWKVKLTNKNLFRDASFIQIWKWSRHWLMAAWFLVADPADVKIGPTKTGRCGPKPIFLLSSKSSSSHLAENANMFGSALHWKPFLIDNVTKSGIHKQKNWKKRIILKESDKITFRNGFWMSYWYFRESRSSQTSGTQNPNDLPPFQRAKSSLFWKRVTMKARCYISVWHFPDNDQWRWLL